MPVLAVRIPHSLPQEEATDRVRRWMDGMIARYPSYSESVSVTWAEHRAKFSGSTAFASASGTLVVETAEVVVHVELPFLAGTFKSQIKSFIVRALTDELAAG